MGTTLDVDGMRKLIDEHSTFEQAYEWEATLSTMVDEPFYEFFPYRLHIAGPEAITAMWIRLFRPGQGIIHCYDQAFTVPDSIQLDEYVSDDAIIHLMGTRFKGEDGQIRGASQVVRYAFEGDRMLSESLYLDGSLTPYFDAVFDDEFRAMPGVEVI